MGTPISSGGGAGAISAEDADADASTVGAGGRGDAIEVEGAPWTASAGERGTSRAQAPIEIMTKSRKTWPLRMRMAPRGRRERSILV